MDLPVSAVNRVIRTYKTQGRIAELNKRASLQVVQGQVDRVTVSAKARQMLAALPGEATLNGPSSEATSPLRRIQTNLAIPSRFL